MIHPTMATQAIRRARTASAILDAAAAVFAREGGYRAATVEAIATMADVAVATLYDHFGSKQDIYLALANRMLDINEQYLDAAAAKASGRLDEVVAIGEAYANFHLDHPLAFRLIGLADVDDRTTPRVLAARSHIQRRQRAMLAQLAAALSRAMDAGQLGRRDPDRTALVLWASLNGVLAFAARGALPVRELEPSLRLAREVALDGLR
jgi:TetR/AcrR family transcriptional regulator